MRKCGCLIIPLLITGAPALAGEEPFSDRSDFGQITCRSPSGDEIKQYKKFSATSDRFFMKKTIKVSEYSGWAPKKHGCELAGVEEKEILLNSEAGPVPVTVVTSFTIYAYADCGTDPIQYMGKTAAVACETSASTVKYSNK